MDEEVKKLKELLTKLNSELHEVELKRGKLWHKANQLASEIRITEADLKLLVLKRENSNQ